MSLPSTPTEGRLAPLVSKEVCKGIGTSTASKNNSSFHNDEAGVSFCSFLKSDKSLLGKNKVVYLKSNVSDNAICVARAMLIMKAYHLNRMRVLRDSRCKQAKMCKKIRDEQQEMKYIQLHDTSDLIRSRRAYDVAIANIKKKEYNEKQDSMFKEFLRQKSEKEQELRHIFMHEKDKVVTDVLRRKRQMLFEKQERIRVKNEVRRQTHEELCSFHMNETGYEKTEKNNELINFQQVTKFDTRKRLKDAQRREFFAKKHEREIKVVKTATRLEEERKLGLLKKHEISDQNASNKIRQDQRINEMMVAMHKECSDANLSAALHNRQEMEIIREQKNIEMMEIDRLLEKDRYFRKVYTDSLRREYSDEKNERMRTTLKRAAISLHLKQAKLLEAHLSKMEVSEQARIKLMSEMKSVGLDDNGK